MSMLDLKMKPWGVGSGVVTDGMAGWMMNPKGVRSQIGVSLSDACDDRFEALEMDFSWLGTVGSAYLLAECGLIELCYARTALLFPLGNTAFFADF